jgi:hypothetical protein
MFKKTSALLAVALGLGLTWQASFGTHPHQHLTPPVCEPGYQIVEETCTKQVERKVCKVVPDVKKVSKWVYSCKEDPFCIKKSGKHCTCDSCSDPQHRIQLVKREVIEEHPTTKCVIETVVETVAYKVYRKVPCAAVPPAAPASPPTALPGESLPRPLPMPPIKQ